MCSACSATSLGTLGMLEGFHMKTSRFAHRKLASSLSYLARSLVLIHTILVGSISTTMVSSVRWKALEEVGPLQSRTAGVTKFLSSGSSVELMMALVSS